jgi:hypothetical protein
MKMPEGFLQADPLFRYVLGELAEDEQARIEEECFVDPALQQELWAVFDDIAERFLQSELPEAEARKFAARLQASPHLRSRVANLQALLHAVAAPPSVVPPARRLAARPFRERWFTMPGWQWAGLGGGTMALALLVITLFGWNRPPSPETVVQRGDATPLPTRATTAMPSPKPVFGRSSTPGQATPPRPPANTLATFFLLQEIVRDAGEALPLAVAPEVKTLELQLEVRSPLYPRYQVTVQTADGRRIRRPNLRAQQRRDLWIVTARFSVADLTAEKFTVQVAGLPLGQAPAVISTRMLHVEKK